MKVCSKCKRKLELCYFGRDNQKKDGLRNHCKDCRRESNKISCKKYQDKHKEKLNKQKKEYYQKNKEKLLFQKKQYYQENREKLVQDKRDYRKENPEKHKEILKRCRLKNLEKRKLRDKENYSKNRTKKLEWQKEYASNNRDKISKSFKRRYYTDNNFRIRVSIANSFSTRLRNKNITKDISTFEYTGFKIKDYVDYLSKDQLWNEYFVSSGKIHLDHIIPCSAYDHTDQEEIKKCWNPRNLRLLPAEENMKKSNTLDMDLVKEYKILDLMPKNKG